MYKVNVETEEEIRVLKKALEAYRELKGGYERSEDYLKTKAFQIGDYVIKKGTTYFDNVFGTPDGEIGKVVNWDFENNYYRVYFNANQPYQGVEEERLEKYEGVVSPELRNKQPKLIKRFTVDVG